MEQKSSLLKMKDLRMVVGLIVYGVDLLLGLNFLVMMWKKKRLRGFGFCLQSETQNKIPERTRKIQLKKLYSAMEGYRKVLKEEFLFFTTKI